MGAVSYRLRAEFRTRWIPGVLDAGRVNGLAILDPTTTNLADAFAVTCLASDGHALYDLARVKLLAGRLPDARHPDDIVRRIPAA